MRTQLPVALWHARLLNIWFPLLSLRSSFSAHHPIHICRCMRELYKSKSFNYSYCQRFFFYFLFIFLPFAFSVAFNAMLFPVEFYFISSLFPSIYMLFPFYCMLSSKIVFLFNVVSFYLNCSPLYYYYYYFNLGLCCFFFAWSLNQKRICCTNFAWNRHTAEFRTHPNKSKEKR